MLFWILSAIVVLYPILFSVFTFFNKNYYDEEVFFVSILVWVIFGIFVWMIPSIIVFSSWSEHASDVSRVVAQEHRIEVQQERIDSLNQRLEKFEYPDKSDISLDRDYPWAAIIESLTEAEDKLAEAKDERAVAIRSIEARKRGPMSGVVTLVGVE